MKQGWEIKKLGEVCSVAAGQGAPQGDANYCLDGTPFIKAGNLEDLVNGLPEVAVQKVSDEVAKQHRLKLYRAGSVVFAKSGMSCMKGHVYSLKTDCFVVSHLAILTPYGISTSFLKYILTFHRPNTLVKDSAYPSISLEDIKAFPISVPPRNEQEKIVAELDCLSGIIEKKKRQLKELDNLAQSIFHEMFGNPLRNERGWGMKRIADVCVVNPPKKVTAQGLGNKDVVSFLPMEDLPIKACYHQPDKTRLYEEVQSSYTCFANDDVLMAKVTPCFENGKLGIATNLHNGLGYGSSEFIVIRANNVDVIKEYIYFVTMDSLFIEKACAQLTGTSGLRRVPRQYVENCNITLPPLVLQQQFASKIEAIEKQKELIKQSIQEAEILFNSRMDYYFN